MEVALVTGASRGIGREIAKRLFYDGLCVAINYNTNKQEAYEVANQLNSMNVKNRAIVVQADISSRSSVEKMFQEIDNTLGSISILVNNAGIAQQKMFQYISDRDWDNMIGVNLSGVFYTCQCAVKNMIKSHYGKIINISSMWGQVGASCEVHYSAAKAGVIGLTKALAKELGPSGITVNAIAPGVIETDMINSLSDNSVKELVEETPLRRIGTVNDVASLVSFLASDKANFITGQVIPVNGGFII